jgi:phage protein
MKTYNPMHRYQKDDAGNDGGGSDKTYTQAEVDELVAGLKNKNGELLGSQKQLKADLANMQEQLKRFDGIDPEAVHNILKRFSDDEEAKLIAEGKIDEVLNRRTERMQGAHQKQVQGLAGAA